MSKNSVGSRIHSFSSVQKLQKGLKMNSIQGLYDVVESTFELGMNRISPLRQEEM